MFRSNRKATTIREDQEYLDEEEYPDAVVDPGNSAVVTAGVVLSASSTTFRREQHPDRNDQAQFDDDFSKTRGTCLDWFLLGMTIVLLTLVGYGFGSGLYLPHRTVGDTNANSNDDATLGTINGALESPGLFPLETNSQDYKYSIMTLLGLPIVMERTSAQARAIDWLAFDDEPLFDPNSMGDDHTQDQRDRLAQRYALVVWYFDQGGPAMWTTLNREESAGWIEHGAGVHECDWRGIDCDYLDGNDGIVAGLRLSPIMGLLLTGSSVSSELGILTNLRRIDFSDQRLQGKIPNSWSLLTNLELVVLSQNQLQSTIPEWIGGWTNLKHLALDRNQLYGTIPSSLATLQKLEQLELQENPQLRGRFDVLFSLDDDTAGLQNTLEHLDLSNTDLVGALPNTTFPSLKFLRLWNTNGFGGTIPTEIGSWSNLEYFSLKENPQLVGSIPTEFGLLQNLTTLELLESNFMSGTLPTELGNLSSNLKIINFRYTNQTGSLPTEWSNLGSLQLLDVSTNKLDGTVPPEYSQLTQLRFLDLRGTKLTGEVPGGVCSIDSREEFLADCSTSKDVGVSKIECSCCGWCSSGNGGDN
eukprot:CAMPEP_0116107178 /NCGR_PEP_ID=MMETSP0327-20121206/16071_1 /TAXON_ID=44447 /ORGANISM="Pseudo-nitzschia delicatissima, Strain B596" /LENGTH=585 /DNA_ID=CAMNT_0003599921 /DNA_START=270 /DNA_END=2027 /DNA_ORIENTATION=-